MKYVTLQQIRNYDIGIPTDSKSISDLALAQIVNTAEANVDAYVGFDVKTGGFDPGTVSIQALWDYKSRKIDIPKRHVPIRSIQAYNIQMSNITGTGQGFNAIIEPGDVAINNFDGYTEIVPLAAITYSLFPAMFGLGLDPPIVHLDCTCGYYIASNNEVLLNAGDNKTFYGLRAFWATSYNQAPATIPYAPPQVPAVVFVNGSVVTTGFTLDTTNGAVIFASEQTGVVSASYTYQIPDVVMEAAREEVLWYLMKRQANLVGLTSAVKRIHVGDQDIMAEDRISGVQGSLCVAAASKLDNVFGSIGIA